MRRAGWSDAADPLARWRGVEPAEEELDTGAAMDPAGTAALLRETRGLARPARLALETIGLVLATEAIALPIGVLLAVVLFRTDVWGRRGLLAIIALAAFVPMPLHATAWLGALGNAGRMQALGVRPILVGRFGAAVVHALAALPWVVLLTGVGLCAVEPELEESALLDFGPLRVLTRITLRRAIGRDRGGRAGGRRADGRRHDRHRPAPGPHLCRGGLRPVHPRARAGRRGGRRAAAAGRARDRDHPGAQRIKLSRKLSARSSKSRKSAPNKPETAPTMRAKAASTTRLPGSPSRSLAGFGSRVIRIPNGGVARIRKFFRR